MNTGEKTLTKTTLLLVILSRCDCSCKFCRTFFPSATLFSRGGGGQIVSSVTVIIIAPLFRGSTVAAAVTVVAIYYIRTPLLARRVAEKQRRGSNAILSNYARAI